MNVKPKQASAEALAILADIEDLLSKDKTPKAKRGGRKAAEPKPIAAHRFEALAQSPSWTPKHREMLIKRQCCSECGSVVEYVAGELTLFAHKRLGHKHFVPLHKPDLPLTFRVELEQVPQCPQCISFEAKAGEFFAEPQARQMDLFESLGHEVGRLSPTHKGAPL